MIRCYIFGGGDIQPEFVREWVSRHEAASVRDCYIAADRGIQALKVLGIRPDVVLGDFDSADDSELKEYQGQEDICFEEFPARKDFTDTELAVAKSLELGADEIVLFGALGTRFDHVLGNLYTLLTALCSGVRARMVDSHNVIELFGRGQHILKKSEQFGHYVSFLPYTDSMIITLEGFAYPTLHRKMEKGSTLGISNEILEEEAVAKVEEGIAICIQSQD